MKQYNQKSRFQSPWNSFIKIKIFCWEIIWQLLCRWTPKPLNFWRLLILKIFGCKIYGKPFVHQRAIIYHPWNLVLHDKACIGDRTVMYALDKIEIMELSVIAQEAYICTGTHNFNSPTKELITKEIIIGKDSFVGARAFVLPGIKIGNNCLIGACSVVSKNLSDNCIALGNPAKIKSKNIL